MRPTIWAHALIEDGDHFIQSQSLVDMKISENNSCISSSMEQCLDKIISEQRLTVLFQPIISNSAQTIFGYEALIRGPSDTSLHSPVTLFETAVRYGRLVEIEVLCREVSIQQFKHLNLPGKLFLNASPEALLQPDFKSGRTLKMLKQVGLSPKDVVIELTEQYPLDDYEVMRNALHHYKEMGFEIAIDDLGAGYAGLRMWSELRPDYVKIDRHFIQDIHTDRVKQEFVRSIRNISLELDCKVIGEGVETVDEYHLIRKMGLEFCQGYYFARPTALPDTSISTALFQQVHEGFGEFRGNSHLSRSVSDLVQRVAVISASTTVEEVSQIFRSAPQLDSVPVVDGRRPLGLVRRNSLTSLMLSRYGRELHGKKPISQFLDGNALMLESHLSIEEVSSLVIDQIQQDKSLEFIITKEGYYIGIGLVTDLLKVITELQIRNARYSNPLTMLPGNVPIYERLDHLLCEQQDFVVCYYDLDNFKPYNDKYGYSKGDKVITWLAGILCENVDGKRDFVGHIGGDDFIVIFQSPDWEARCKQTLLHFKERVKDCYSSEDLSHAGIWAEDRSGNECFFPLLSLSIGAVNPDPVACKSHHDVAALASDAKHMAKKESGNSLYIERRRHPHKIQAHQLQDVVA